MNACLGANVFINLTFDATISSTLRRCCCSSWALRQPVLAVQQDRLLSTGDPLLSLTTTLLCENQTKPCRKLVTEVKIDRTCAHKCVQWDGGHLCVARHPRPLWFLLRFNLGHPLGRLWSENPRHLWPSRLRHLLADQNRPAPVRFVRLDAYESPFRHSALPHRRRAGLKLTPADILGPQKTHHLLSAVIHLQPLK